MQQPSVAALRLGTHSRHTEGCRTGETRVAQGLLLATSSLLKLSIVDAALINCQEQKHRSPGKSGIMNLAQQVEPLYTNRTLVGNWWDDRHMPPAPTQLTTAERVLALDPGAAQFDATTTKRQDDDAMLAAKPLEAKAQGARRNKPCLYPTEAAVKERIAAYLPDSKPPDGIAYTLGRTALQEAAQPPVRYLETTTGTAHRDFTRDLGATDRTFFRKPKLAQEVVPHIAEGEDRCTENLPARGELTRRPREAGNPYGVSVFVDEYAGWGRKLAGTTLGETVSRKMTTYF